MTQFFIDGWCSSCPTNDVKALKALFTFAVLNLSTPEGCKAYLN